MKQIEKLNLSEQVERYYAHIEMSQSSVVLYKIDELVNAVNSLKQEEEIIECQWENCTGGEYCKKHSLLNTPEAQEVDVRKLCNELLHLGYDYSKSESGSKKEKKQDERVEQIIKTIEEAINRNKE